MRHSGLSSSRAIAALSLLSLLVACSKPVEKTEDVRPVRVVTATNTTSDVAFELSGEVRPRIESRLGFRVGGKIVQRKVELGTVVKRGQLLMQLDPQDLLLAQTQAKAALTAAESNRDLAQADLKRYQELRAKNFVAAAILDSKEVAYKAAQASFEQAVAGFKNQSNQAGYATLIADVDGVVTGIDAEVGQVVAAGTPVVRVAQTGEMDVVVGIPENKINTIRQMSDIRVGLWADPTLALPGKLRELSPVADAVTRTYLAKVSLPADAKDVRLGMTANVSFVAPNPAPVFKLPTTALFQDKGQTAVWIVSGGVVKLVPVKLAGASGEDVLIAGGISSGQQVVTAGVNLLKQGQKVSILGAESPAIKPPATKPPVTEASASAVGASK
ncbi:efflux RND transporter periplasmic adaptor subunit [Undibacterium sp. FT79W]|nr:efflux RND transporter periplasmic adaptor subunit [Undibacterium sp. FT79W]MBC3877152.1 efflux RND transporter periplasmic adaptor subunit [Undibacterium sp. FT79W]